MLSLRHIKSLLAKYHTNRERQLFSDWLRQQEDETHAKMLQQVAIMQSRIPAKSSHYVPHRF